MIDTKDFVKFVITQLEGIGNDTIIPLDDLENGEFAYIDEDDAAVYLVTVARAKLIPVDTIVEL